MSTDYLLELIDAHTVFFLPLTLFVNSTDKKILLVVKPKNCKVEFQYGGGLVLIQFRLKCGNWGKKHRLS